MVKFPGGERGLVVLEVKERSSLLWNTSESSRQQGTTPFIGLIHDDRLKPSTHSKTICSATKFKKLVHNYLLKYLTEIFQ